MENNENFEPKLEEVTPASGDQKTSKSSEHVELANDLLGGAIEAVKLLFSSKPLEAFDYVKKSKVPLGYALAGVYVLAMTLASMFIGAAPIRAMNQLLGGFRAVSIPYGELFVRGFVFGAVSLVAFIAAIHIYFVLAKKNIPIQNTINFVATALTPVTLLGVVVFIVSFIHSGFASTLLTTSSLVGIMLLIGGLPKFLNEEFKFTWILVGCIAVAQAITVSLLNWTVILGTLGSLF